MKLTYKELRDRMQPAPVPLPPYLIVHTNTTGRWTDADRERRRRELAAAGGSVTAYNERLQEEYDRARRAALHETLRYRKAWNSLSLRQQLLCRMGFRTVEVEDA